MGITTTTNVTSMQNGVALAGVASRDGKQNLCWAKKVATNTPLKAETGALLLATKITIQRGWIEVQLFSDSFQSVQSIYYDNEMVWTIRSMVLDIRPLISTFVYVKYKWVRRSLVSEAHKLGQLAQ